MRALRNLSNRSLNILLSVLMIVSLVSFANMNISQAASTYVDNTFTFDTASSAGAEIYYSINGSDLVQLKRGQTLTLKASDYCNSSLTSQTVSERVMFFVQLPDGYTTGSTFTGTNCSGTYQNLNDASLSGAFTYNGYSFAKAKAAAQLQGCDKFFYYSGLNATNYANSSQGPGRSFIITATPVAYSVVYDANGGSSVSDSKTYYHENTEKEIVLSLSLQRFQQEQVISLLVGVIMERLMNLEIRSIFLIFGQQRHLQVRQLL